MFISMSICMTTSIINPRVQGMPTNPLVHHIMTEMELEMVECGGAQTTSWPALTSK